MSGLQEAEARKAATEKALEGARLLAARDYEGSIAACTEAIELNPGSIGARRTRAEAYRQLGMGKEAEGDLARLGYKKNGE